MLNFSPILYLTINYELPAIDEYDEFRKTGQSSKMILIWKWKGER